jgi:hypothetical protein
MLLLIYLQDMMLSYLFDETHALHTLHMQTIEDRDLLETFPIGL